MALVISAACVLLALVVVAAISAQKSTPNPCTVVQQPKSLREIAEASGLTLSRRVPSLLWSHNDSGMPVLFAVDASGALRGRVKVADAIVEDWEDITAARCPAGDCLYIADIGDNNRTRRTITIYRVPEPRPDEGQTAGAEVITATYPDGPHDAEALFVVDSGIFIVTKDDTGALYRLPLPLPSGKTALMRVGQLGVKDVTDADASRDGREVVVRTNDELVFYKTADLVRGDATPRGVRVSLHFVKEPQGEGVTPGPDGTLYLSSEGSGAGWFTTLRCPHLPSQQ